MKKTVYAVLGAVLIVVATLVNRVDGGGVDLMLMIAIGVTLLLASADLPTKSRDGPPCT